MPATEAAGRPRLLYISPVMPHHTGNGVAMRALAVLRALSRAYRVTLLVDPKYPGEPWPAKAVREACERVAVLDPGQPRESPRSDETFDVVHVFRLAALEAGRPYLGAAGQRHLDLDDVESETRRRLAVLCDEHGKVAAAEHERQQADISERLETAVQHEFERVYVCSERDRTMLSARGPADVRVLPNTFAVPGPIPPPLSPSAQPFAFLFTGTLSYFPNEDGIRWWCTEVLPLLRRLVSAPFTLHVVGTNAEATVGDLAAHPGVQIVGRVPDLAPWYAQCSAVIVPLRAGGGTRIKLLEAFGHRRPVVSTSLGAEGIAVSHDVELLLADTPEAFAAQCARLIECPETRTRLTQAAIETLVQQYQPTALLAPLLGMSADR